MQASTASRRIRRPGQRQRRLGDRADGTINDRRYVHGLLRRGRQRPAVRQVAAAFHAGNAVLLQAGYKDTVLGANQVYAVTDVDATNQTISLYNPLGAGSAAAGMPETTTLTLAQVSAHGDGIFFGVSARMQA